MEWKLSNEVKKEMKSCLRPARAPFQLAGLREKGGEGGVVSMRQYYGDRSSRLYRLCWKPMDSDFTCMLVLY